MGDRGGVLAHGHSYSVRVGYSFMLHEMTI